MNDKNVIFAEEDTMFRLMETAINGSPTQKALEALHYFFGENIDNQLRYLVSIPTMVNLPSGFCGIVCEDEKNLPSLMSDADYVVTERTEITHDLMKKAGGRLKFIQKLGTDYKNVDIKSAKALSIPAAYMRRIGSMSVGEHVLMLILALSRNLISAHQVVKKRKEATDKIHSGGPPRTKFNWGEIQNIGLVRGQKLGFVGFGENASEAATLAHRIGMKILYFKRNQAPKHVEELFDAQYIQSLEQLVAEADFVSIHVPYKPSTEKMFNQKILSYMKHDFISDQHFSGGYHR